MKKSKLIIALLLLGTCGVGNVWADPRGGGHRGGYRGGHGGGHVSFGVMIGSPYWGGPWFYPPPAYYHPPYYPPYYPQVVVERQAPQVYIEQQVAPAAPPAPASPVAAAPANYWYYCATAKGYYPYVSECPSGWQRVLPQPQGQP
ncbi:MAG: hypothetical protein IPI44_22875 [Sulfuritalea sp.]|nr:hypothetical protein [Sulfuritalea sp.]